MCKYDLFNTQEVTRLGAAAQAVLTMIQTGEMFADHAKDLATEAADRLESAIEALQFPGTVSPFLKYRSEVMGEYSTAHKLRALVLHLWNDNYPVRLSHLFGFSDERHTKIALEMIVSYTHHGERDEYFMDLAQQLREMAEAAKVEEEDAA